MPLPHKLVIYESNLGSVLRHLQPRPASATGPDTRFSEYDRLPLRFDLELSPEAFAIVRNSMVGQQLVLEMVTVVNDLVRTRVMGFASTGQAQNRSFRTRVEGVLTQGGIELGRRVERLLARHAEMDQAWGKYFRGQRKDLIFAAIGIGLTVASVALVVPTGGVSIGITIAAGAKSVAEAVKKLSECWRTADEQRKKVETSIKVLLDAYLKSVHRGRAIQITGAVIDTIGILTVAEALPFVRNQLMPNVSRIKSDMEVHKGKLGHLYVEANRLSGQLFELLDQIDEWKRQNPGQTMPNLAKVEARIDQLLDSGVRKFMFRDKLTIAGAYSRYEAGMQAHETLTTQFQQLQGLETHPRQVEIIRGVIKILGKLAYIGAGYGAGLDSESVGLINAGSATSISSLTATVVGDAIGTTADFIEFSGHVKGDAPASAVHAAAHSITASYASLPVVPPPRPQQLQVTRGTAPRPAPRAPPQTPRPLPAQTVQTAPQRPAPPRPPPRPYRGP